MWNERYRSAEYAYGTAPNVFFKAALDRYGVNGRLLLPAEGEGRNAVYAAQQGLAVTAFDISEEGRKKAMQLAADREVHIDYRVGDFLTMDFTDERFDAAALIYAHFPPELLTKYHRKIARLVKPGGLIILEGFSESNLPLRAKNPKVGGPNKRELLFTVEKIQRDFSDFAPLQLEEVETVLAEGDFHQGIARVVRFVGKKAD